MERIDTSKMIFVFGSNEAGRHGAGAARYAHQHMGAIYGVSFGLSGQTFTIPTMDTKIQPLSVELISKYVEIFLDFAERHPGNQFQVTCIGCGLGGKTHSDIAPMFKTAPHNCFFDDLWQPWLEADGKRHRYWGTF